MDSKEARKLKEGFLVKKGHVRHNWKTRWFILYDEMLVYFKKKDQIMYTAGEIPLKGCFLVSPCTEYTKKEGVFRITTKENVEYLLQAANEEEREEWTTAIANAVRRLDIKYKRADSEEVHRSAYPRTPVHFTPTQIREMVEAMQDADAGIPLDTHMCQKENKTHKLCFTGIQVIDWLLKWSFVSDRDTGVNLACALLEDAHLQPVGLTSKMSFKRKTEFENATTFLDNPDALYRFSALRYSANEFRELEYSDDSSDSEDEIPRDQCGAIKGNVVKQGFLQKKGHVRHNWKTRKFILCTEPTMLFYCRPTKEAGNKRRGTHFFYEHEKESNIFSEQRPRKIEWTGYRLFKPSAKIPQF
ncbi:pleckstrin-2-like isoform X2 [Oculina patagonica]